MNVEALTMTQLKMACAEIARSRLEIIIDSTAAPFSDAQIRVIAELSFHRELELTDRVLCDEEQWLTWLTQTATK